MSEKKSYLVQLLGTATKVRIFEQLCLDPTPITRHALTKSISGGIGPTYEQADQLIALGALKEVNGGIQLDDSFPFHDDIVNIVASTSHYMDQRILLDRIDSLFGSDHYITGYLAARQNGPPVDHEQDSALVAVLHANNRSLTHLRALSAVSPTKLKWLEIHSIPSDITRQDIYGSNIWIASTERGIVDCVLHQDCSLYVVVLLLLQNLNDGNIDGDKLLQIANNNGIRDVFLTAISGLNDAAGRELVSVEPGVVTEAVGKLDPAIITELAEAARKAYNTFMEG